MLLWKKLKMLERNLNEMRAEETELLKEICQSNNYTEIKELFIRIKNYFPLPSLEENKRGLRLLERMIYNIRYKSALNEEYAKRRSARKAIDVMVEKGEYNFNLENVLNIYIKELNKRKYDIFKSIYCFATGILCFGAFGVCVFESSGILYQDLFFYLYFSIFGTALVYEGLTKMRPSAIKSITENKKILIDKIDDIHIEKVRTELKGHINNDTLSKGNGNQLSKQLPNSFNGEPIKERPERGQGPMSRTRKMGKYIEK